MLPSMLRRLPLWGDMLPEMLRRRDDVHTSRLPILLGDLRSPSVSTAGNDSTGDTLRNLGDALPVVVDPLEGGDLLPVSS